MQPTPIGAPPPIPDTNPASATGAAPTRTTAALSLPANFPVQLSPAQCAEVSTQLDRMSLAALPQRDIALLGSETEASLHRTLGAFLQRIEKSEPPCIFKLVAQLHEAVDREDLPGLAERILNGQPSLMDKVAGFFSKKAVAEAAERSYEEARALAAGKSKRLSEVITTMEHELRGEQVRLDAGLRALEPLKTDYRARFVEFAQLVAFMHGLLEKSRTELTQLEADPATDPSILPDLRDKLQALETRALAIEGTLSRLPSDQRVIHQLQNNGISTQQEANTTASSRLASIKRTLLTIHGDDRLEQARQLKTIVDDMRALVDGVEQARLKNAEQSEQARTMFSQARDEMLQLGQATRPDRPLPA